MSAADSWSRRGLLGAGTAFVATSSLGETILLPPQRRVIVTSPAGPYGGVGLLRLGASFWAIRYGTAPRFRRPTPVPDHREPYRTGEPLPHSPQQGAQPGGPSEDCLFLNVWTPDHQPTSQKRSPVVVYFHGGAYSNGTVADRLNLGAKLAERGDVVVVTVNHRLNAFGYLYLPDRFPDSGNAGQLDLILALKWVQRNIAAFGGDPGNVTVFGQSGGGAKIATLMAMPAARGLFHKAITMSGQQVTASGPLNAAKRTQAFLAKLGTDPATAPVEAIVAALSATDPILGGNVYMGPVLDGRNLPRHPFYPDAAPQSLGIPMLLGNTISETRAFFGPDHPKMHGLDWSNIAARLEPELRVDIDPERVVRAYRDWFPGKTPQQIFIAATTDSRSWRGQVIEAEERAKAGAPAFVYQLDFEDAQHTDDIGLAFGTTPDPTPAQAAMSDRMMDAFVRFTRTGNPGWPSYMLKDRATMIFDTVSRVERDPRRRERELFATVPYIQPGT